MLPWINILQLFVAVLLPTLIGMLILPILPKNDILRLILTSMLVGSCYLLRQI